MESGARCRVTSWKCTSKLWGKELELLELGVNHNLSGTGAVLKGAAFYVWEVGRGWRGQESWRAGPGKASSPMPTLVASQKTELSASDPPIDAHTAPLAHVVRFSN